MLVGLIEEEFAAAAVPMEQRRNPIKCCEVVIAVFAGRISVTGSSRSSAQQRTG